MPTLFTEGLCLAAQQALNDVAGANAPALQRTQTGYLDALVSAANTEGVQAIQIPTDGKSRKVQLTYFQRGTPNDVVTAEDATCAEGAEPEPLEVEVGADSVLRLRLKYSENQLRRLCVPEGKTFLAQTMMAHLDALNVALDKELITLQALQFGQFADGTTSKTVQFIDATTKKINDDQFDEIFEQYAALDAKGRPMLIGAGDLGRAARRLQLACCNDLGTDASRLGGQFLYFRDQQVNKTLTPAGDHYIVLAPGAVHPVFYNKYVGSYAYRDGRDEAGTLTDPFTGITYDVKVLYDKCKESYFVEMSLHYGLFILPANAFKASDELSGVNYTLHFVKP